MRLLFICTLLVIGNFNLVGKYEYRGYAKSTLGKFKYIATLNLNEDSTYHFVSASFNKYTDRMLDSDTVVGQWFLKNDTLYTQGYNVKWVIKRNRLIQISAGEDIVYKKQN